MIKTNDYESMVMLDLPDSERDLLSKRLTELSEAFAKLDHIKTDEVEPLITILDTYNIFREDIVMKAFARDEILANAPEAYDGCFQVPGTLD